MTPLTALLLSLAAAPSVPDSQLAAMRGGFALPGGIDVSMAIQTDTAVDGHLVLRTVFTASQGQPQLQLLVPGKGGAVAAPPGTGANGVHVTIGGGRPAASSDAGLVPVTVAAGASVATGGGTVSVDSLPDGSRVHLQGVGLDVSHLVGAAIGSVTANTVSDRTIQTVTSIGIDVHGATPLNLGSAMSQVQDIALDAVQRMSR